MKMNVSGCAVIKNFADNSELSEHSFMNRSPGNRVLMFHFGSNKMFCV
jgi:hypothetical protein